MVRALHEERVTKEWEGRPEVRYVVKPCGGRKQLAGQELQKGPAETGSGRMPVTNLFLFLLEPPAGNEKARPKLQMRGLKQTAGEERAAERNKYQQMFFDRMATLCAWEKQQ